MKRNNIKFVVWESPIPETIKKVDMYYNDYLQDVNRLLSQRKEAVVEYQIRGLVFPDDMFEADGAHVKKENHEVVADSIYTKIVSRFLDKTNKVSD